MKTALEILKETHQELSTPNPADWKSFDVIMSDGTGEAMLKAMERFALQFKDDNGRANYYEDKIDMLNRINEKLANDMFLNMQYYMEYCEKNNYVTPKDWIESYKMQL